MQAAALDELRDQDGYPASLYDASDRIVAIYEQVVAAGQPYIADRVRLIVDLSALDDETAASALTWPEAIAIPTAVVEGTVRLSDLADQAARDVVTLLTRDLDLNGSWKAYRTATGETLRASWRYRLPEE